MKKLLLSSVALLGFVSAAAAADLPRRTVAPAPVIAPVVVAPAFTWTGFYAGISGGYIWNDARFRLRETTFPGGVAAVTAADFLRANTTVESDGFIFGGQIGGNLQLGIFVVGLEADISWTDLGGSNTHVFAGNQRFVPWDTTLRSDMEFLGTVRGRLGVAFDRFMVYGTGGLAYGDTSFSGAIVQPTGRAATVEGSSGSDISVGWVAGVGGEWAFTNNLTFKIEWLHYELEDTTLHLTNAAGTRTADYRVENAGDLIRGGINFKF